MKNITFLLLFVTSIRLFAQEVPRWMRYPSISPDGSQIAFTFKGNIYKVSSDGGLATQLTFHEAHDYKAVWSNDGSELAFASDRYGNFDIFLMSESGGSAERLTFHSNDEIPYTFSADDSEILFGAVRQDDVRNRQFPDRFQIELYGVPTSGGRVKQHFSLPAELVQSNRAGNLFLYQDRKGGEDPWRKHHTSSITRDIWVYDAQKNTHQMLTSYEGEDRQPIFTEDEKNFYYLSEESGTFNIHKMSLENPGQSEQLTDFDLHPVRFLSFGNGVLSFGFDGELYTMRDGEAPVKLKVEIRTQEIHNRDKYISIGNDIDEMAVSPNGKEIAFITRGDVFVTSVGESFTKRITNTPERERFVTWGPEGKSVVYSSERKGRWSIYKTEKKRKEEPFFFASTLLEESIVISNDLDNYLPDFSPDGTQLAFIEGRRTLKVMNLETNNSVSLMTPDDLFHMRDGDKYFTWSPDSKWLLTEWDVTLSNSEVLLLAADGSKRVNLNESGYYDGYPKWVNGGEQMLWFSNKNGLKSYATSGRSQDDVYSMFFTQKSWDEFNLSEEDYKLKKAIEEEIKEDDKKSDGKKEKSKKEEKIEDLKFDWERMKDQTSRLTIHSSDLGDAVLSEDGEKLYYLSRFEENMNLWSTNLRTKDTKMVLNLDAEDGELIWDKKMDNLFLLSEGKISKVDLEKEKTVSVKIKGEVEFDVAAERKAMFDHVWLRTNGVFYHSNFHGVDWSLMKSEYEKYIPSVGNMFELTELFSEMLGELNVSHAGARYRGNRIENADATASLGIFMNYSHEEDGILIDEVISGGPLDKSDFNVKSGMVIYSIDGEVISKNVDVAQFLNRKVGQFTLLEIKDPASGKTEVITIKPISLREENKLLYKRWVKKNEKQVDELSNGQLGYVHIPGMGDKYYRSIYDDMMGKFANRKAMIIDARFNGGGDLVADLAMFFTGESFISYETEDKIVGGEPTSRWTKPTLALLNEDMYSDGHCFACGYTDLKIGKTVGMPVPGTCSFSGWERLPDGTVWGVVPISAKDKSGQWMENNQTEPMVKVKNMPGKLDKGIDQQLNRAVEEMLKDL